MSFFQQSYKAVWKLSVMPGGFGFLSRLFLVICAAVVLIMLSNIARAGPISQKRLKYSILRRQNMPQPVPSSARLLYNENEVQAPADTHQLYPVQFTRGSFSHSQNSFDKTRPRVRITNVQGGGMRPASSIFTTHSQYEGQSFDKYRIPQSTVLKKEENTGSLYDSNMDLLKYPKKLGRGGQIWKTHSSKVDEDASTKHLSSVLPSQARKLQSALSLTPEGHGSDFKETKQFSMVRVQSGGRRIQPIKILDFTSPSRGDAESFSNSLSVIKQNPSRQRTSVSEFPQNSNSISNKEMTEHRHIQRHYFKGSPAQVYRETSPGQIYGGQTNPVGWAHKPGAQVNSKTISNFDIFTRKDPKKQESEAQIGFSRPLVILYPSSQKALTTTPAFLHPASAEDKNLPSLASVVHLHSQDRKMLAPLNQGNLLSGELSQDNKLKKSVGLIHRLDGLRNSGREPVEETSGSSSADGTQSNLDKDFRFTFSKAYPYLSQKYSFGQRRASVTTTTTLSKPDRAKTSSSSTQASFTSTAQPFTATSKSLRAESEASVDRNATENRLGLYKGVFGLKGFSIQPLEGANGSLHSSGTPIIPKPSFKGFELRSSGISRTKRIRIHRLPNQWGERKPDNSKISPTKELSSGNFKIHPNTVRGDQSVPIFKYNNTSNKYQSLQGFQPSKNRTGPILRRTSLIYSEQSPLSLSKIASSSYLKTAGPPRDDLSPLPWPRAAAREEGVWFQTPTRSVVMGKRVMVTQNGTRNLIRPIYRNSTHKAAIRRLPKVKAVTYADILGSASFSSVRAVGHHQDPFSNVTVGLSSKDEVKNMNRSPVANDTDEKKDGESVERKEEADNEIETSDLFSEIEGSGALDLSDVLLTENEQAGNELLELDYLQKSTGNVSFKSLSKSHLEQQ